MAPAPYVSRVAGTNVAKVTQLWEVYPALEPLYSSFEKSWDSDYLIPHMHEYQWVVYAIAAVYVALVIMVKQDKEKYAFSKRLQPTDKKRWTPPWLKHSFGLWNLGLALFSCFGMLRTVPHLAHFIATKSFRETVCDPPTLTWGHGATGMAVQLFIFSKLPELGDTLFLTLKGADINLLQWYHHCTVLTFCWHSYVTESGSGLWFVAMNYTVHWWMYFYFFLMNYRIPTPGFYPPFVTAIQIIQMLVGTAVVAFSIYYRLYDSGTPCANDDTNLIFGGVIYSSYLLLFIEFAIKKYGLGGKSESVKEAKKEQ